MSDIGSAPFTGYTDGGDFLLEIDNKCVGHCTEHKLKYSAGTKDRQVKAAKTVTTLGNSKFKEVTVTDLSMTGSASGYIYAGESELDIDALRGLDAGAYRSLFRHSAVRRAKLPQLLRNAKSRK